LASEASARKMGQGSRETMTEPLLDYTPMVRSLVLAAGRDPAQFEVESLDDGSLKIRGPSTAAFYPAQAWTLKHLHRGFFDAKARTHPGVAEHADR
jgi:hypothetical protein